MASLRRKINYGATALVAVVLVVFGVIDFLSTRARLQAELDSQSQQISARLSTSLPKPLWDFAVDTARKFVVAELANPDLRAVMVHDGNKQLLLGLQAADGEAASDIKDAPAGEFLTQSIPLELEENGQKNAVGIATLYIDDSRIQRELRSGVINTVIRVIVMLVVLQIGISYLIGSLVTKPLNAILTRVKDIDEGEGDLTRRVEFDSNDELGELARTMNHFVGSIRSTIADVIAATHQLNDSAALAGQALTDLRQPLDRQEQELTSLVAALNQMTATSQHVAQSAAQASHKVAETQNEANAGLHRVGEANASTQRLAEEVGRAGDVISELQKHSQSIGAILDVIRNIAEQTNLLALNAAIEAARAGDQGRGFAVVADEVRVLAKRTQESTGEIQHMIEQLQQRASSAVQAMQQGRERADTSVQTANAAGQSFNAINESISHIADMNTQIATATEQQTATMQEIDRNVVGIHSAYEHTLAASEITAQSEQQLRAVVARLTSLVSRFKT
ncbi:methyl-accepting chemotaxis protein [Permianibacter sp. IMCC34836]|uniref:methyl-accepting chemotaxis protein n=1 Tax=Permianibacter fluminis TaxID=2738515 RepID=UPI00155724B5|nr:methyl-accepting chemotaxis protein [Permianibacter fluminis]NQD38348.1 methyl-accepting chemotaxis protein [Permianibacter fluminis]